MRLIGFILIALKRFMCRFYHSQLGERFDGITKNYSPKYSENEKNLLSDSRGNARRSGRDGNGFRQEVPRIGFA